MFMGYLVIVCRNIVTRTVTDKYSFYPMFTVLVTLLRMLSVCVAVELILQVFQ